jgi:hypothetical protein
MNLSFTTITSAFESSSSLAKQPFWAIALPRRFCQICLELDHPVFASSKVADLYYSWGTWFGSNAEHRLLGVFSWLFDNLGEFCDRILSSPRPLASQ